MALAMLLFGLTIIVAELFRCRRLLTRTLLLCWGSSIGGEVGTVPSITTPLPDGNKVEEPPNVLCGVTPRGNVPALLATLGSLVGCTFSRGSVTSPSPPGSLPRGPTSLGSWPSS